MNRKFIYGIVVGICAMLVVELGGYVIVDKVCHGIGVYLWADEKALGENTEKTVGKLGQLREQIDTYYMDEIDEDKLVDGIYKGYMEGLGDPYTCYYTKEEYKDLMQSSSGTYCGIGATVTQNIETGAIYILDVFDGGAAKEAGLTEGDMIYKIAGEVVVGKDLNEVVSKIKGEEGTTVEVQFYLHKEKKYKDFTLERRQIEVPTVAYKMKENKIGYIAVSAFDEPTDEQFIAAMKDLEKQGMKGVIVDLRDNGGGMLDTVVNMLDYLLPEGKTIVSIKDKNGKGEVYRAKDSHACTVPMVVLVNGNTASASEVFSGAIQDLKIGTIVGTTTFGKGIVQSVIPMWDGSAIKITTSKYYSPKGRNIHGKGIKPDVVIEMTDDAKKDIQYQKAITVMKKLMQ
ncbi:MAG: S41 family peptidase [Lachnospiraceae bacterium]|nr:S41 family peptidase [Lachnospiraceae bacterium]